MLKSNVKLYPHQQEMVQAALKNEGRLFICASTGSGKTLGSVAVLQALAEKENRPINVLVVVPAALRNNYAERGVLRFTEDDGLAVWEGSKEFRRIRRPGKKGKVNFYIVSYALFRKNPEKFLQTPTGEKIDGVVCDEIHRAKNFTSKTAKALIKASTKVKYFIGLTGTASSNTPAELVPVMMAVTGKKFPVKSPEEFKEKYLTRVKKVFPDGSVAKVYVIKDPNVLRDVFKEHVYYLDRSSRKLDMPDKLVEWVPVPMSKLQRRYYDYILGTLDPITKLKIQRGVPVSIREAKILASRLVRAQQVLNGVHIANPEISLSESAKLTPKIKKILDDVEQHLKNNPKGKVLIFSNYVRGGIDVVAQGLKDRGIKFGVFVGRGREEDIPVKLQRKAAAEAYRKGKIRVLVLSPAGAEGLDFPNTTFIAMADPHYNPEQILQMEARGIRIGGLKNLPPEKRKVLVRRYYSVVKPGLVSRLFRRPTPKTLEQWKYTIALNKAKLNAEIRQVLRTRHEKGPIHEAPAAPTIKIIKERRFPPGYTFRTLKLKKPRKTRSDKGKKRGPYRPRRPKEVVEAEKRKEELKRQLKTLQRYRTQVEQAFGTG